MCTLCRSLTQPEMEYDCENARYNQPGMRATPGLSIYDQKVWGGSENKVSCLGHSPLPGAEAFLRGMGGLSRYLSVGLCLTA